MIAATGVGKDAAVLDVGGGLSRLADHLVASGWTDVTELDLSAEAIARSAARVGAGSSVRGIVADVTTWTPDRAYAVWHDRAVLHFLIDEPDRARCRDTLRAARRKRPSTETWARRPSALSSATRTTPSGEASGSAAGAGGR